MSRGLGVGMTQTKTELGRFLRVRRLQFGLSQASIGKLAGIRQNIYSALETGLCRYPNIKFLEKIANALKCGAEELQILVPEKKLREPKTELGKFIEYRRKVLGLTRKQLAKMLGFSGENGGFIVKKKFLRVDLVKKYADILKCDPTELESFVLVGCWRMKESDSIIGSHIRRQRVKLGITQEQLAEKMGVTKQYVSYIELGKEKFSRSKKIIKKIASALLLDHQKLSEMI